MDLNKRAPLHWVTIKESLSIYSKGTQDSVVKVEAKSHL